MNTLDSGKTVCGVGCMGWSLWMTYGNIGNFRCLCVVFMSHCCTVAFVILFSQRYLWSFVNYGSSSCLWDCRRVHVVVGIWNEVTHWQRHFVIHDYTIIHFWAAHVGGRNGVSCTGRWLGSQLGWFGLCEGHGWFVWMCVVMWSGYGWCQGSAGCCVCAAAAWFVLLELLLQLLYSLLLGYSCCGSSIDQRAGRRQRRILGKVSM